MSSSDSQGDTWKDYLGERITSGLTLALDTVNATVEYGKERIKTPDLIPETFTSENLKMCFDGGKFSHCIRIFFHNLKLNHYQGIKALNGISDRISRT